MPRVARGRQRPERSRGHAALASALRRRDTVKESFIHDGIAAATERLDGALLTQHAKAAHDELADRPELFGNLLLRDAEREGSSPAGRRPVEEMLRQPSQGGVAAVAIEAFHQRTDTPGQTGEQRQVEGSGAIFTNLTLVPRRGGPGAR